MVEYVKINKDKYLQFEELVTELLNVEEINLSIIQEKFATLSIELHQEFDNSSFEIDLGDVTIHKDRIISVKNNITTIYQISERQARQGELIMTTTTNLLTPFSKEFNKFYIVTDDCDEKLLKWIKPHVVINNCCVYDSQYVVLEKIIEEDVI
jgi:hypothetical protein